MRWIVHLLHVLCCCIAAAQLPTSQRMLDGTPVTCADEGREVSVPIVANNSCIRCFCEELKVVCTNHQRCTDTSNCHMIVHPRPPKSCCEEVCKGCEYGGKVYASDETWADSRDPCITLECKAGIITRTKQLCHTPCRDALPVAGQCCPVCRGCSIGKSAYERGMVFPDPKDVCTSCTCQDDGNIQCSRRACSVLNCPHKNVIRPEGSCCPICRGKRRVFAIPNRCLYHPHNMIYMPGQTVVEDACGKCVCQGGTVVCDRQTCPRLECPSAEVLAPAAGECCPRCKSIRRKCRDSGVSRLHGGSWYRDLCTRCYCDDGTTHCRREDCASNEQHCPQQTHELQYVPGACCPQCIEKSATCVVFGDPHYRTFDGLLYTFQGVCQYVLARPCSGKVGKGGGRGRDFSVTVQNGAARRSGTPGEVYSFTDSVTVRVGELIVTLHQDLRTSVDGVGVALPWVRVGHASVVQHGYSVTLSTHVGVRVLWDGGSYAEVTVPRSYKGRMCGLCGNYNGESSDDWTIREGQAYETAAEFGERWRKRGPNTAATTNCTMPSSGELQAQRTDSGDGCGGSSKAGSSKPATVRHLAAEQKCSILKSALFSPCSRTLRVDEYYEGCVRDICHCPAGKQCLCDVIKAFQKACRDSGALLDVDVPCGG